MFTFPQRNFKFNFDVFFKMNFKVKIFFPTLFLNQILTEIKCLLLRTESQDSLRTLSWKFQSSLKIYSARVNKTNIAEKDSALHEQKDVSLLPFPDLIWIMF